ncbi:hypothetical protein CRG98_037162 [Punica granatum]|uniref:Uncharacterized protein n=1 Tax=Punica granatum TaxID=22663 RepID=A0A2I0IEM3_PUNGR|nr:hypothetical protein CRG98_037162 [Punica granatum]
MILSELGVQCRRQPIQPRQAGLPVGSASRPDCTGSGLFVPAESPDSLCHFSDSFLVFRG